MWMGSPPQTKVFQKAFRGGVSPKWHLGHSVLLPGILDGLWHDKVESGLFLSFGGEEETNQGVLKPKGFCMVPAEKRYYLEQSHAQAACFSPKPWPQQPGQHITWAKEVALQMTLK